MTGEGCGATISRAAPGFLRSRLSLEIAGAGAGGALDFALGALPGAFSAHRFRPVPTGSGIGSGTGA